MTEATALRLDLRRHTLDNGLRVVLHRDTTRPLVAVNLWYHVGSKHEEPGKTGFAHLFEHLLFQGSQHVGTNDHFRLVQQAGGVANGSTWYDRTNYYATLPSHHLDLALWLESDRMGYFLPAITQEKLDTQRDVVLNERRQRVDNQPYGTAFEHLHELFFPAGHPYRWPVIGHVEDLRTATLEDVRSFCRRYYAPANAVLTVAGDFDDEDAAERVARYFADLPAGRPAERPAVPPPRADGERRMQLPDGVRLPRFYFAYPCPAYGEAGWYAADVLSTLLADGKTSRLHQELVYERQLAQDVSCFVFATEEPGAFYVVATARSGVEVERLAAAVDEELAAAATPPSAARLEQARNQLLTDLFRQLQTVEERADLLSRLTTFFDDPDRLAAEARRYRRVTAEEVASFAAAHLRADRRAVVTVVPREVEG